MTNLDFQPPASTAVAPRKRWALRILLVSLALAAVGTGGAIGHVLTCAEDSCVIWVCSVQGNRVCGPDTPPIFIQWPEE